MPRKVNIPAPSNPPQIVEVEWLDAAMSLEEGELGLSPCLTAGYYIRRDRNLVEISSDWAPDDDEYPPTAKHVIHRSNIVRFTYMAPAGRRVRSSTK